jgi:adenosylmethionine-8-amino-7-oxononanoate aminotransferase
MPKTTVKYPEGHVLLRNLSRNYPMIDRGEGLYLFDLEGRRYIDASGGALVNSLGHGQKALAAKIAEQMGRVGYVNGTHFSSGVMEQFAEKLSAFLPTGVDRIALLGSGSEAIEAAVKFVRQLWVERGEPARDRFIARSPGYHGNTLFALSASARPHYKKFFGPLLNDVAMVPAPDRYRYPGPGAYDTHGADYYVGLLEAKINELGPANVAGFLIEPVSGSSLGGNTPPPGYLKKIEELCHKHGVLIVADEVLCGTGRTGPFLAGDFDAFKPDLVVLGKGINGGLCPMSVLAVKQEHVDEIKRASGGFMHAQTYLQSPVLAATGLAILDHIVENDLIANSKKVGEDFHKLLGQHILPLEQVGCVSGRGLLAGVDFVADKVSKKAFARSERFIERFIDHAFFKHGLVLWPNTGHAGQGDGDLIMMGPPLNSTKQDVAEIVQTLRLALLDFK